MEDIRSRRGSLVTTVAPNVSETCRRYSFDFHILPSKEKRLEISNSFGRLISEVKSSVSAFLDDSTSSIHKLSNGITREVSKGNGDLQQHQQKLYRDFPESVCKVNENMCTEKYEKVNCSQNQENHTTAENSSAYPSTPSVKDKANFPQQEGIRAGHSAPLLFGTNNKKKCVEWMSKIPEEKTPKIFRKAVSESPILCRSYKGNKTEPSDISFINGKKFTKANSDLGSRVKLQDCLLDDHAKNIGQHEAKSFENSNSTKEPFEELHGEIKRAIYRALDEIGDDKLATLMHANDSTETNITETNSDGTNSIIPECEQCFFYSPHIQRKFSISPKGTTGLEKRYMRTKTDIFTKSTSVQDISLGKIEVSFQYLIVTKRLQVTIQNVSGLQKLNKNKETCDIFVNTSIATNRKIKNDTQVKPFRCGKTTQFNHTMYFQGITIENVHLLCLRFGVYKKPSLFSRKYSKAIAECFVYLDKCNVIERSVISESLIPCE